MYFDQNAQKIWCLNIPNDQTFGPGCQWPKHDESKDDEESQVKGSSQVKVSMVREVSWEPRIIGGWEVSSVFHHPRTCKDYKWYISGIMLPIGWLYITYHLVREPETAIDCIQKQSGNT